MPRASIVVPAFNSADTLPRTLRSLLAQTCRDFEVVIVNDGSIDETPEVAEDFARIDSRIRVVHQANRGLAGARNSGIAAAQCEFVGFCDADDLWAPGKLEVHVDHLSANPEVGLSFSGSMLIDMNDHVTGHRQAPRLRNITPAHVFKRNPVGNGSAAVMRREALSDLAYRPAQERDRDWVFDEKFRQSEDIECWLRLALTTTWRIEGVEGDLTLYRVNTGGLSANTDRQLASWERMVAKLRPLAPQFFARHEPAARAYQLRYLARRAISDLDGPAARRLMSEACDASLRPFIEEPSKTLTTFVAAHVLAGVGPAPLRLASGLLARRATN